MPPTTDIFISAGEASGEAYGALLIAAATKLEPDLRFFGLGGPKMRTSGCDVVVESHDVAVVGLAEVVAHLPRIYSRFRRLLREIDRRKPKAAVLIDFPDFNFRLAKALHKRGIPVVYFVSPQLWAWRQSRLALVKKYVAKMLVIFPFEEPWYRERGVDATYVGHPLADLEPRSHGGTEARTIVLLPGSRKGEIERNLPALLALTQDARMRDYNFHLPVAPTLDRAWLAARLGAAKVALVDNAPEILAHARAAVVASGTATVEAALAGTPFVVVYRLSALTWRLGRRLVKLDHFAMPNLIAGRRIVPELIQDDFTAENVVTELQRILPDGPDRTRMITDLAEVRAKLHPASEPAADRAARELLRVLTS